MSALDKHQKTLADQMSAQNLAQSADAIKMATMSDMFAKHMALMEALNKKCDAQGSAIVENRKILQEKIKTFEGEIVNELKQATQYLDLKAYDASIEKVEKDITHFFKELGQLRTDFEDQSGDLKNWREKLAGDMQIFYNEYDDKIKEGSVTDEERQLFKEAIRDLNNLADTNSANIKLIAKELTDSQETIATFNEKVTQI